MKNPTFLAIKSAGTKWKNANNELQRQQINKYSQNWHQTAIYSLGTDQRSAWSHHPPRTPTVPIKRNKK